MRYEQIEYEVSQGVLTLTLNRPDKLNAFTRTMMDELLYAIDAADADDEVRAVVVTGAGRAFCAGADLSSGSGTFDAGAGAAEVGIDGRRDGGGRVTLRLFESTKPWIAAINGAAVGVGLTMTLAMDLRLASTQARMGLVFARRGIVPEACSSWFLPRLVGVQQALEWIYTGRVFAAQEALEAGLLRSVHAPESLLDDARSLAREIADNTSAISIALARQMVWRMSGADHPMEAHKVDSRAIRATGASADAHEGVASFLEKRPPHFTLKPSRDLPDFYPWWPERVFE